MRTRWLKILLVVAVAFALTMTVLGLGRRSAHSQGEMPSFLWVTLLVPGNLITDYIKTHVNNYLLLSPDIEWDPKVLWPWLEVAFNTLFYSGLFGLLFMFVGEARRPAAPSTKSWLKAITIRLLLSAAITLILGMAAGFLHFEGTCWGGETDCPAYSPMKIWISFLLAPPIFLLQPGFFESAGNVSHFNPVVEALGLPLLWAYYFGLISVAKLVITRFRVSKKPLAITAAVLLASVVLSGIILLHPTTRNATPCEFFIAGVAVDFRYPELCSKIPFKATEDGGFNSPMSSLRSNCFLATAVGTQNAKLCGEVKPVPGTDGRGMNESDCIDAVARSGGHWGSPSTLIAVTDDDLAKLMRQLGYTNQTLDDMHLVPQDNSAWSRFLDDLRYPGQMSRKDFPPGQLPRARLDFLRRVKNLQCGKE